MELFNRLREIADKSPDRVAIVDRNASRATKYGELYGLICRVASKLKKSGVKKGDAVIIRMERSMEYMASEFGILAAGCVAVPVLTEYPEDRVEYISKQVSAKLTVDGSFFSDIADCTPIKPVVTDREARALVLFTSGSTGRPKGIVFTPKVIDNFITRDGIGIVPEGSFVYAAMAPMTFVACLGEYYSVLSVGGCTHIMPDDVRADIKKTEDYFAKNGITMGFISPRMLKLYRNSDKKLKMVGTGSECVSGVAPADFVIQNNYGQSETCGGFCTFVIDKAYDVTPIGKPRADVTMHLFDGDGNEVPDGEDGEICVDGVFPCEYLGLPEETKKVFQKLDNGLVRVHTGDIGRKLPDGNYLYINRKDWMVKINGQRVDLGEVEGAIKRVNNVSEAAVKDFKYANGQIYLCAYYVGKASESEVESGIKKSLPPYMMPTYFIKLEKMPTNINGKLDKSALIPPDLSKYKAEYVAPTTENEIMLCNAFEELLRCGKVGACDNFFLLGGDSIKAMQLQNMCDMPALTTDVIVKGKTPRAIAAEISKPGADIVGEAIMETRDLYPLTPSQLGVYLECVQNPSGTMYNNPFCFEIEKAAGADINRVIGAVRGAVNNHGALKLRIINVDGKPMMKPVDKASEIKRVKTSDADLPAAKRAFVRPFDIYDELYRLTLFETESKYSMMMDFHHLIFDGTSASILFREISMGYDGVELPKERMSQFMLGIYEEKLESSKQYEDAKAYFDGVFSALDEHAEIVCDRAEDAEQENKPNELISVETGEELRCERVESAATALGVTPNIVFLGAFEYALGKFCGCNNVVVTAANHGRHDSRMDNTFGMMVRTVPLYANIENEEKTICDFLAEVRINQEETIAHDCYPFMKLAPEYGLNDDIMFAFQSDAFNTLKIGDVKLGSEEIKVDSAIGKLGLMIFKENGGYKLNFRYRSDIYDRAIISSFADMYLTVLAQFLEKEKLKDVVFAGEAELKRLDGFLNNRKPYDASKTVVDIFREQVKKTPNNVAVVYLDRSYTYAEVDEISERIAGFLKSKGIGRGNVVSVLIPRCEYIVIASLGVLKTGAAYQPLDPSYPPDRLSFMMSDAKADFLIADKSLVSIVSDYKGETLLTEDICKLKKCAAVKGGPKPNDAFIMLYTSGTTGKPKGVILEHSNLVAFNAFYSEDMGLNDTCRVGAYASYGFDACMLDVYPTVMNGAAVYIIDEEMRLDLDGINNYFEANGITHAFFTTQVGRAFATTMDNHSLKVLGTGGEKLVPIDPPKNYKFYNVYGPTECTIFITKFAVDREYLRVPIGPAVSNTNLYVLDKYDRRMPVGAIGELCAAGPQVGRGYHNRPEQKAFTVNPFCDCKGYERMYRTGDTVRFLADGSVDILGRKDGQVKIRGFRIELAEVERTIREFDGIKDATVVAKDEPGGGKCIAAYVVSDATVDVSKLNAFIAAKKPSYMVPAATMQIDAIPLNVNGKVDKRKLPEIVSQTETEDVSTRPATMLEEKLVAIVAGIIGTDKFGLNASLQRYGLTSLSVIKLAVELKKQFGIEVNVKALMKDCSIIMLENEIQNYLFTRATSGVPDAVAATKQKKSSYPLSKSQFGVYAECMRDSATTKYNIPCLLRFPLSVKPETLAENVKKVIAAHPAMFTHLIMDNEDVEQVYSESGTVDVPISEMTEERLASVKGDFVQPFNLFKGPLFRFAVVKTERYVALLCDFQHIVFDGASLNLFIGQLKESLEGETVSAETYTFFDYIDKENEDLAGEKFKQSEKFFADMLADCESASEIAHDVGGKQEDGALKEATIVSDMTAAKEFCAKYSVTPAHLYLAATAYAVSRFVNNRGVYLSTISNGRSDLRLTDCFGMFVKTLPVGVKVDDVTCAKFVQNVKDAFTGAIDNELYPYETVCSKYNYAPNIMYEYQLGVNETRTVNGEEIVIDGLAPLGAKFKCAVHIELRDGSPAVVVQYNDALYSQKLMQCFAECIETAMERIVACPDGKIRKISLLTEKEKARVDGFAVAGTSEVKIKLLHKMFEAQVDKTPDAVAVIAKDGKFTYSELDKRANAVANSLIARGLKKGGRAVVLLRRTSNIFACELGICKAGGVFIPTSPDYPKERIDAIIDDSEADFVITEDELLNVYKNTVDVKELISCKKTSRPKVDVSPEDLVYMIYTSGSTGKPKGVMLRHIGIANYLSDSAASPQVHEVLARGSVYGSVTTIAFDMNMKETMLSLCNGLTLAFADDDMTLDPFKLSAFFKECKVDVFNATPSRLMQYLELDEFAEVIAGCTVVLSGGEGYPEALLKLLREKTKAKILNTYGPTEITVSCNCADLTDAEYISVGRPLSNYYEYIVDCDDNPLPVGVVGELVIAGLGVAAGYKNLPEKTAEAFTEFDGRRAYRSGDYAKWTEKGEVVILGRKDNQVKIRGLRIELGEIEKCLSEVDGIKRAVILIKKLGKEDAICAYYTADKPIDADYIKGELKKKLTEYMIPSAFCLLDEMPLTPNGKVNVKALPEPQAEARAAGREPRTLIEKQFCEIFANILGLEKVYVDDSFFDLGGTSLNVTRVIIAANKANINVAYGDIFAHPTPADLSLFVSGGNLNAESELDFADYNYYRINKLLAENNLESFTDGKMQPLGNILLTGATGFLGMHILHEFLHNYPGNVFCLARGHKNQSAEARLNGLYFYYFEEVLSREFAGRIDIIEGDITDKKVFETLQDYDFDTVVNCAAVVKHFSKGTEIEDVNYYGALNIVDFCKRTGRRLVHTSTMSVGGAYVGQRGTVAALEEGMLFFGQELDSKYTRSKFMAERAILDEAANNRLSAKIMRVGTLAPRNADGEYQINFATNNFMRRLKSVYLVGVYPYEMIEMPFELSPIDSTAKAILKLAETPEKCVVFHPYNNNTLFMGNLYEEMNDMGLICNPVETAEYLKALDVAKQDSEKVKALAGFIAYENSAHGEKVFGVGKSNKYTMQVLYRLGFRWPVTSTEYMRRFIASLKTLGFFDA